MCINHHNKLKLFESPTFPTWVETIDVSLQWSPLTELIRLSKHYRI